MLAVPDPGTIDHVPLAVASVKGGVTELIQTLAAPPAIAETVGNGLIVNDVVVKFEQPFPFAAVVYLTVTVPAVKPVTTPPEVILAVPVPLTIDHVPDGVPSVKAGVVEFTQTDSAPPVIDKTGGKSLTFNDVTAKFVHPPKLAAVVYITVTVPGVNPVTTPPEVIVAVPVPLTIDQVPPTVASVNAGVEEFIHTDEAPPAIAETVGNATTVKDWIAEFEHPLPSAAVVYLTVTVPAVKPVTTPPEVMLAVPVPETIDHVPDGVSFVKAGVVELIQTDAAPPAMEATVGKALTVTSLVAIWLAQPPLPVIV